LTLNFLSVSIAIFFSKLAYCNDGTKFNDCQMTMKVLK
jgi:hypothetical protein